MGVKRVGVEMLLFTRSCLFKLIVTYFTTTY